MYIICVKYRDYVLYIYIITKIMCERAHTAAEAVNDKHNTWMFCSII